MRLDKSYNQEGWTPKMCSRKCVNEGCKVITIYTNGICGVCGGEGRPIGDAQVELFSIPAVEAEIDEDVDEDEGPVGGVSEKGNRPKKGRLNAGLGHPKNV